MEPAVARPAPNFRVPRYRRRSKEFNPDFRGYRLVCWRLRGPHKDLVYLAIRDPQGARFEVALGTLVRYRPRSVRVQPLRRPTSSEIALREVPAECFGENVPVVYEDDGAE